MAQAFSKPKFAPNGAKTIPIAADGMGATLGMAIQLGDGGSGQSKLGSLVRGTMPRPAPQPVQAPQAPQQPALGNQPQGRGGVAVKIVGITPEGEELVDMVELTFPPGTDVQSCQQIRR